MGRRLVGDSIAPWMLGVVLVLSVLLSMAGMVFDFSLDHQAWIARAAEASRVPVATVQAVVHSLLEWTTATISLIVAFFALAHCRTERSPEALILASGLPLVALADLVHAFGWISHAAAPDPDQSRLFLWLVSRTATALIFLVGGFLAVLRPARLSQGIVATGLGLGLVAVGLTFVDPAAAPRMLYQGQLLARPWDLLPLLGFLAAGLFVFPQLHRLRPSVLNHALMLSMLPQILAQLEATLGSRLPEDSHAAIAHLDKLLAAVTILSGVILDYVHNQRLREDALSGIRSATRELQVKSRELVRADGELVDLDMQRRRAERELKILEKAIHTMSLGVTVTDPVGRILYVNPADARMHGYTVDELLGKNARMYSPVGIPPSEDSDSVFLQPWTRERTNITKDGRVFPVRLVSDIVRDDENQPIALVTLCEDISERKRIEAALERRDRILEAVGFAAERFLADASWEASVEEVLESLKKATAVDRIELARVTDLKPHALDDTWIILDPSRDTEPVTIELPTGEIFPRWEKELRQGRLLQGKVRDLPEEERLELETRGVKSFSIVPIFVLDDWLGYLFLEDDNEEREWSPAELEVLRTAARTFGAAMHRKQAEIALAASQAKYQDLLESASDLVLSFSPQGGRFQFVNRAWKDALGYNQEEVSRLSLWDVVHPDHHQKCHTALGTIFDGGQAEPLEVVFVTKNGKEIYVEGSLNCRFVNGEPVATRGIFRDITERKAIDRMKSEFISTVSHELRTPLTSIIASLGLLQSGRLNHDSERTSELVAVAYRNSNRLLQLINDLLDVGKLVAGKILYRVTTVDVAALLEEVLRGIHAFAESFKIHLELGEVEEGLKVRADRDRLIQVLNNLMSNAIKFSPEGETVTVSGRRSGERVVLAVTDNGTGIPEEFRGRLFEQFTQVDGSATRKSGGSGLGLSIVKGLVEGMDGEVRLDSALGRGTTFYVDLPAPKAEKLPKEASAAGG